MHLFIDNRSGVPIYDQIYRQIRTAILDGTLPENAPLPSIRSLAKDLQISVITSKRAYEQLEEEGFIYTAPARGSFVAPKNTELVKEENLRKMEEHIAEVVRLAKMYGVSRAEIDEMIDLELEETT